MQMKPYKLFLISIFLLLLSSFASADTLDYTDGTPYKSGTGTVVGGRVIAHLNDGLLTTAESDSVFYASASDGLTYGITFSNNWNINGMELIQIGSGSGSPAVFNVEFFVNSTSVANYTYSATNQYFNVNKTFNEVLGSNVKIVFDFVTGASQSLIAELRVYGNNDTPINNFSITAKSFWDNGGISNFSALLTELNYFNASNYTNISNWVDMSNAFDGDDSTFSVCSTGDNCSVRYEINNTYNGGGASAWLKLNVRSEALDNNYYLFSCGDSYDDTLISRINGSDGAGIRNLYFDVPSSCVGDVVKFQLDYVGDPGGLRAGIFYEQGTAFIYNLSDAGSGSIDSGLPSDRGSLYNISVSSGDWFTTYYSDYNISSDLVASLKQSQINITPKELISNDTISNFSIYVNGSLACNVTGSYCIIYPDSGSYTLSLVDNAGESTYHTTSASLVVSALDNTTKVVFGHAHEIFVYARTLANATINNFSATLSSLNRSDVRTLNTTTGVINFDAIHDTYNISVDAPGYALSNNSQLVTVSSGNYTIYVYLYTTNSVNISIYDSGTGLLIDDRNVTIDFIGATAQTNITSTGNLYVDLLNPSEYTLSYTASGYRVGTYVFTLEDRSTNNINLYLDAENTTSLVLITVQDKYSKDPIPNALVTIQRYVSSAWITEQIFRTDFNGQGEAWFVVSTEYYNFLVEVGDTVYFGVINSNVNKKVIYAEDVSNGIVISIDVNPVTGVFEYQSTYDLITSINFTNLSNTTGRFTFFWDDTDNLARNAELVVSVGNVENCTSSVSSESGSLTCNVEISAGSGVVYFTAVGYIDGIPVESKIGVLGQDAVFEFDWGSTGWIITLFLTLIGFTMFLARPKISIFVGTGVFGLLLLANVVLKGVGGEIVILLLFIAFAISKIPTKVGE